MTRRDLLLAVAICLTPLPALAQCEDDCEAGDDQCEAWVARRDAGKECTAWWWKHFHEMHLREMQQKAQQPPPPPPLPPWPKKGMKQ